MVSKRFFYFAVHSLACYIHTSIMYYALTMYQASCYVCGLHTLSHLIPTSAQVHRVNNFQSCYSYPRWSDSKAGACNNKNHVTLFWRCCAQMISPGSKAHVSHVWWRSEQFLATSHTLVDGLNGRTDIFRSSHFTLCVGCPYTFLQKRKLWLWWV